MTKTEKEIRDQLAQALIAQAENTEKVTQLRAMLKAVQAFKDELMQAETEENSDAAT